MTWKTLGESLEAALASMMDAGEEAIAVASDAVLLKEPASTEVPAVVGQEVVSRDTAPPAKEDYASRHRYTGAVSPNAAMGSPTRPVYLCLIVSNEGDGPARVEGERTPGRRAQAWGRGGTHASKLKLVVS